jgi:hypothetical protein
MRRLTRDRHSGRPSWWGRLLRWLVVLLVVAGLACAGAVLVAGYRWRADSEALRGQLRAQPPRVRAYVETELANVPIPVSRFFRAVLRDGQPIVTRADVTWDGQFNMGRPGADDWRPFTAQQRFVPGAPGMVWDARIRMAPGLGVLVRDGFVDGRGTMRGAVLGLVTVVSGAETPALATAALQRYLAEAVWFPTALLPSQGVAWTAIDDRRARATIRAGAVSAAVEFRFDGEGRAASMFVPDRLYDDGRTRPEPRPWQSRILGYAVHDGLTVPTDAVVEWLLPAGAFAYWKARPTAVAYAFADR